ncbi:MAG: hypothetical protein F4Y01_09045 [Gammaproteobacteria bacterium]|nr:hypothetical protein [Gammaproteobacteria bacterium]MYE24076.1 hypothetical protein [Gammaproteobacteria bacterium]
MTESASIKDDLAFVRAAAEGSSVHVPAIYLLWAAICLVGFPLVDVVGPGSSWIGIYWTIAGPLGGILTWRLAVQAGRRAGQADRRTGKRWMGHFLAFFGAGLLGMGLIASGQLSWSGVSSLWILLLALTYFLAGLHLERRLMSIGVVLAAGYLVTLYLPEYGATTAGVAVATALVAQAWLGARAAQHAAD